jgi:hypothetical protein
MSAIEGQKCDPTACEDGGELTCQLTDEREFVYGDSRISNAEKGDLFLCPATSNGTVGALLGALIPAQHFTHMGILVDDNVIRQCTFVEDRVQDPAYMKDQLDITLVAPVASYHFNETAPVNGFAAGLVRYGWPGTVSLPVHDAIDAERYGAAYPGARFLDADHPAQRMYQVKELSFSPVAIEPPTGMTHPFVLPPLLVKPCTAGDHGATPRLVAWDVADTAAAINGHYRFYAFSDGTIGLNPDYEGPSRRHPVQGVTDAAQLPSGPTLPLTCSSFIWTAVRLTDSASLYDIVLDTAIEDNQDRACLPLLRALEGEIGSRDAATKDGLYLYDTTNRLLAARTLFDHVRSDVHKAIENKISKLEATAVLQTRSEIADWVLGQSPIDVRVANQLVNTFATDAAEDLTDTWLQTGEGRSTSPDDIFRFWDQTSQMDFADGTLSRLHGLYGHNEKALVIYARPEERPVYRWAKGAGRQPVKGIVQFNGTDVVGITVKLNCTAAVTGKEGYTLQAPSGRYRITAGMLEPVSELYVSGFVDVTVKDGDPVTQAGVIALGFPSEDRREIVITGHADTVDRRTVGPDRGATPDIALRPLQVGPAADIPWDPERMVWAPPNAGLMPTAAKATPSPGVAVRLGDWDYAEKGYESGSDTLMIRVYVELVPQTLAVNVIVNASIDEDEIEVSASWTGTIDKDGSDRLTIDLKSAEIAPDRAHVELHIANNRCPA